MNEDQRANLMKCEMESSEEDEAMKCVRDSKKFKTVSVERKAMEEKALESSEESEDESSEEWEDETTEDENRLYKSKMNDVKEIFLKTKLKIGGAKRKVIEKKAMEAMEVMNCEIIKALDKILSTLQYESKSVMRIIMENEANKVMKEMEYEIVDDIFEAICEVLGDKAREVMEVIKYKMICNIRRAMIKNQHKDIKNEMQDEMITPKSKKTIYPRYRYGNKWN